MNKINNLIVSVCTIFLLAASGMAAASCKQSNAKGTWRIHAVIWDISGIDETETLKCKLKTGSNGAISASKSSCKVFSGGNVNVTGGKLVLAENCAISGSMKTAEGTAKFRTGQMDRSKESFTILGVDPVDSNFVFYIDGIKQ